MDPPGSQPYSYLYPPSWTVSNPTTASNYIFLNDSLDSATQEPGGDYVIGQPHTYFAVTDSSYSSIFGTTPGGVPSNGEYAPNLTNDSTPIAPTTLLSSLLIDAVLTNVGERYQVNVVLSDTSFTNNGSLIPGPVSQDFNQMGYQGLVTIGPGAPSVVPEPASTITGLTGAALLTVYGMLRRRRSRRKTA